MDQTIGTSCLSYSVRYILLPMLDTHCLEEFMFLLNLVQGVLHRCGPSKHFFTSLAFAFVSLLGLVCTTSGHISGIDSQFSPFSQISRHSLDRVPLLYFRIPPLHLGRYINLSNSIEHKLF